MLWVAEEAPRCYEPEGWGEKLRNWPCSNPPRGFEGNIGGAAKRTYVNRLWKDKTLPSVCLEQARGLPLLWELTGPIPVYFTTFLELDFALEIARGTKAKDRWVYELSVEEERCTYTLIITRGWKTPLGECWHGEAHMHHMFALSWWPRGSDGLGKVGEFRRGQHFEFKSRSRNLLREKKNYKKQWTW